MGFLSGIFKHAPLFLYSKSSRFPFATPVTQSTQPAYKRKVRAVFDNLSNDYDSLVHAYFSSRRRDSLATLVSGCILEIGCGSGRVTEALLKRGCVVAVDISFGMARIVKEKYDISAVVADAEHLPFRDAAFDAAVAAEMIYYVDEPVRMAFEVRRILRGGGRFVFSAMNQHWYVFDRIRTYLGRFGFQVGSYDDCYSRLFYRSELVDICERAGFGNIASWGILFFPFVLLDVINRFLERTVLERYAFDFIVRADKKKENDAHCEHGGNIFYSLFIDDLQDRADVRDAMVHEGLLFRKQTLQASDDRFIKLCLINDGMPGMSDRLKLHLPEKLLKTFLIRHNPGGCGENSNEDTVFLGIHEITALEQNLQKEHYYSAKDRAPWYARIFGKSALSYHFIPPNIRNNILYAFKVINDFYVRLRGRRDFPAWPCEASFDMLRRSFLIKAAGRAGVSLNNTPYPGNKKFAAVLTHDIESADGVNNINAFRTIERNYNIVSAWSLVSDLYAVQDKILYELIEEGCEIFSHGYMHDGRLPYLSSREIRWRLEHLFLEKPWLREYVKGFRSGQLLRSERLSKEISHVFDYDLTRPDTELYGPYRRTTGCCTVFPFRNSFGTIEMPLTIPQDYHLLKICKKTPGELLRIWNEKIDYIENLGGVAVFDIHPDSYISGNTKMLQVYDDLLKLLIERNAYIARPIDVYRFIRDKDCR